MAPPKSASVAAHAAVAATQLQVRSRARSESGSGRGRDSVLATVDASARRAKEQARTKSRNMQKKMQLLGNMRVDGVLAKRLIEYGSLTWRDRLFRFVESPTSSCGAGLWMVALQMLAITDCVLYIERSLRENFSFHVEPAPAVIWSIFVLELVLRVVADRSHGLWRDALVWTDVLCLVPVAARFIAQAADSEANEAARRAVELLASLTPLRLVRWAASL